MSNKEKRIKVVMVTGMLPSGHYSQILCGGLEDTQKIDLLVYTDKSHKNLTIKNCGQIIPVWSKSLHYIPQIIHRLLLDQPDVVHFQHEFNMYGGMLTALFFPVLLVVTRILGPKVIVTIHAAAPKEVINDDFVVTFNQDPNIVKPILLKTFFAYIYSFIGYLSNSIVVHTNIIKTVLSHDYKVSYKKITVIPCAIPKKRRLSIKTAPYFLYFGYMVRRKGLGYAIEGFKDFVKSNPHTKFKLILAGGVIKGQESALTEIKEIVVKNKLQDKVEIRGFIEEVEQDKLYRKAYCVIIPAILSISSSGPLYHAESHGKCVIASKIGNFLEDVKNNKTGILINNHSWSKAFEFAVDHPEKIAAIERNTLQIAKDRSPLNTALQYLNIYQKIYEIA